MEITESVMMTNPTKSIDILHQLDELGIEIAVDDFGTGYSSLSYFKQLPVSELKIDKSFILNLVNSKEDRKLVRLMIAIAQTFNLRVVAEGIENEGTYNFLRKAGCDYAQGFFICKPKSAKDFINWLNES